VFWRITYYAMASLLALGGAALTWVIVLPEKPLDGWHRFYGRNRIRIFGVFLWLTGVGMIVYGLFLERGYR